MLLSQPADSGRVKALLPFTWQGEGRVRFCEDGGGMELSWLGRMGVLYYLHSCLEVSRKGGDIVKMVPQIWAIYFNLSVSEDGKKIKLSFM